VGCWIASKARRLARRNQKTGERRSLQQIANELAELGHLSPLGKAYFPGSIKKMLAKTSL
jgi:hypothetical protein